MSQKNDKQPESEETRTRSLSSALGQAGPYLYLGSYLAGNVLLGVGLGYAADRYFETQPWLLLGGSVLGIGAGFYHFFKAVLRNEKPKNHEP